MKSILKENLYLLSPEERLEGLTIEERLEGLTIEERLEGLTIEELEEIIELAQKLLQVHPTKPRKKF